MNEQEIKKSVDELVTKILETEKQPDAVAKAITSAVAPFEAPQTPVAPVTMEANQSNGGASQTLADPSALAPVAKAEDCDEDEDDKDLTDEQKKAKKAKMKKSDDKDEDDEKEDDEKDEDKFKAKKAKMKKSIQELSSILDEEELELVKAWREESEKEAQLAKSIEAAPQTQPTQNLEEVLRKAIADSNADLRKSLDEKDTLIKSLSDKVEKMASQPAYDRRSISNLEVLEKSGSTPGKIEEIKKSQVLDTMLSLQAQGKGITSHHVAEFEATGNISDARVKRTVFQELKLN